MSFLGIAYIRFSLQLICCESVFLLHCKRRKLFWCRLPICLGLQILACWLLSLATVRNTFLSMLIFIALFALTLVWMFACFRLNRKDVLFFGTGGYALQHSTYCLMVILTYVTGGITVDGALGTFLDYLCFRTVSYVAIAALAWFVLIRPCVKSGSFEEKPLYVVFLSFFILIIAIVLNELSMYRIGDFGFNPFTINVVCKIYSILSCITVLLLQCLLLRNVKVQRDNELLSYMMELQKNQYSISQETINLINIKCHDLKHQITALANMGTEEREKALAEMKNGIGIYDSIAKTGNSSLDLVLMEKSLLCDKYQIKFSYIVDAEKLSLMKSVDIYSLFGNAIDNAIESVCLEEDSEKRLISLNVRAQGKILFIHLENYFEGELEFSDGLPVSKRDSRYHGFGTKSIQTIVRQYGGEIKMTTANSMFNLDILIPIKS